MDTSSFFIDKKAMFGSYPSQPIVDILENKGVRFFVNLTHEYEKKITPYSTKYNYISFPIPDGGIPTNKQEFILFIYKLCNVINNLGGSDSMYIHCKGGHGRSGVVVACIVSNLLGISSSDALDYTKKRHSNREIMRDKWRRIGSPQTMSQLKFVHNMCNEIVISNENVLHPDYKIDIPLLGSFKSVTDAINKLQQPTDFKETLLETGLHRLVIKCPMVKEYVSSLNSLRFDYYMKMF